MYYKLLNKMIQYCNDNNLKSTFFFIGSGTKKDELVKLTSHYKNVFFFSEMSIYKINKLINYIWVLFFLQKNVEIIIT